MYHSGKNFPVPGGPQLACQLKLVKGPEQELGLPGFHWQRVSGIYWEQREALPSIAGDTLLVHTRDRHKPHH